MENNTKVRNEILKIVSFLTDQQLNTKKEEDSWSIMQVLQHLYLLERVVVKAIHDALASKSEPASEKLIHLSVDRTRKVKAPAYLMPSEDFITLEEMKEKLTESRQALTELVSNVNEEELAQKSYPHPVFGPLSLSQWISFIGYHEKRHLAQIEEIKAMFN